MPTTVTRYVNTDSTAGGDGTTNATAGANRAYASLNEAVDANPRNLVTADEEAEFICSGSADDTTPPTISSTYVCDSTHKIIIRAAASHGGKWNTGVYRLVTSGTYTIWCSINTSTNIHIVEWWGIQFSATPASSASSSRHMFEATNGNIAVGSQYRFMQCIMRQVNNAGYTANTCRFFRVGDGDLSVSVNSSLFYDWQGTGLSFAAATASNVIHCTFINCSASGIACTGSVQKVRECIFKGCAANVSGTITNSNYNSTDIATTPTGWGGNSRASQTFTFVDESTKDFHLASTDAGAKGFGNDESASAGSYTNNDIDGDPFATPYDIGMDQYVASGGVSRTDITIRILA